MYRVYHTLVFPAIPQIWSAELTGSSKSVKGAHMKLSKAAMCVVPLVSHGRGLHGLHAMVERHQTGSLLGIRTTAMVAPDRILIKSGGARQSNSDFQQGKTDFRQSKSDFQQSKSGFPTKRYRLHHPTQTGQSVGGNVEAAHK